MLGYALNLLGKFGELVLKFLNWGIFALLLSFLTYDKIKFAHKDEVFWGLFILTIFVLVIVAIAKVTDAIRLRLRANANSILGLGCHCIWRFDGSSGTLENQFVFHLRNISSAPQRTILHDRDGFNCDVAFTPKYAIIQRSQLPQNKSQIISPDPVQLRELPDYASNKKLYVADWTVDVDPPLQPNEDIEICRFSVDKDVAANAFSAAGDFFAYRCSTPFRKLMMTTIAPVDHLIKDVQIGADDQAGKKLPNLLLRQSLEIEANRITNWEIPYPGTDFRYTQKFRLEKLP